MNKSASGRGGLGRARYCTSVLSLTVESQEGAGVRAYAGEILEKVARRNNRQSHNTR